MAQFFQKEFQDFQYRNIFEVIFLPYVDKKAIGFKSIAKSAAIGAASAIAETLITKFYIKSISIPNFIEFNTEMLNETSYISSAEYPKEVTFVFREDQFAVVRTYLMTLRQLIGSYSNKFGFVFNQEQTLAKRNCIISPLQSNGLPGVATIKIEGMTLKSIGGIELSHGEGEPYEITATFAVNKIDWITPASITSLF